MEGSLTAQNKRGRVLFYQPLTQICPARVWSDSVGEALLTPRGGHAELIPSTLTIVTAL